MLRKITLLEWTLTSFDLCTFISSDPCPGPADIVFVLDASNSIVFLDPLGWDRVLEFVRTVVEPFPVNSSTESTHFGKKSFHSAINHRKFLDTT